MVKKLVSKFVENVSFSFTPSFQITEGHDAVDGKWLRIGGLALEETVSRNNNSYSVENLAENNGREFKWIFGHHRGDVEEHIVGMGKLSHDNKQLFHEGKIRNTSRHPDVVEMVKDGMLGPSIHATAKKVVEEEGVYHVEGLEIEGVALVAFQGVKTASIDYALAESFELNESQISGVKEQREDDNMSEEIKQPAPEAEEVKAEAPVEAPVAEPEAPAEDKSAEEALKKIAALEEELASLKKDNKSELVESILKVNKDLKSEDLLNESVEKLELVLEYEKKLSEKPVSQAVVEAEIVEPEGFEEVNHSYSMTKESYKKFNEAIRNKVR